MIMDSSIKIDGSILEGGGQILRNSMSLSAILQKPIIIENIRNNRPKPGLRSQHLTGLELIAKIHSGNLEGGYVDSTTISFDGGKDFSKGKYTADTKTAGSVCLVVQAILPCLVFGRGNTEIILKGGTNATMAPQADYFIHVFRPILSKFGVECNLILKKRGFYPVGKGEAILTCEPVDSLKCINLVEQGKVVEIEIISYVSGVLHESKAEIASQTALKQLKPKFPNAKFIVKSFKENKDRAIGTGSGIIIIAKTDNDNYIAGSALGSRDVGPEKYGNDAALQLIKNVELGGALDEYAQDQVIIFMALAEGTSKILVGPIELHTETSIHFAQLLTGAKFNIEKVTNKKKSHTEDTYLITCEGIGFKNKYINK